ncbi:MAG TPA: symmetrical bis(5'-nucleosyl)-tetraphosphatase [Caldimonas sp.]|jgi:bis(5'-nucleosyl)-tetraphosphatase (symmetrical)|nr:symmetrical bis(5'-nucleosyl)-tetraphosphatase [Caldimonas sp.]HEX2542776.1 symmetrical bis(5'-nucleosyl)-tetraphosphatase [Caldimonas sp.]
MNYVVGDIQGCAGALDDLLEAIAFSPSRDRLYVLGDLVNRGPASLATLRRLRDLGDAAVCVLGNHDWHLLAVAAGVRPRHRTDTLDDILDAPDRDAWLEWLRRRRMAVHAHGWLMLHAGVVPQWDLDTTLTLAHALERALQDTPPRDLLDAMFGNEPACWGEVRNDKERLRFTLNTLTRIRFVSAEGRLEFSVKDGASAAPPGYFPWFDAPARRTATVPIAFGHWSTLGLLDRPDVLGLDTGCAWGGQLTAARLDGTSREIFQVQCRR